MNDPIERRDAIDAVLKLTYADGAYGYADAKDLVDSLENLPSAQQEPKTGHWIDADGDNAICSCCNRLNHLYGTYCKHCGAKMVEPQESEDKKKLSWLGKRCEDCGNKKCKELGELPKGYDCALWQEERREDEEV